MIKKFAFLKFRLLILIAFLLLAPPFSATLKAQPIDSVSARLYTLNVDAAFFTELNNKHLVFIYIIDDGKLSMEGYIYSGLKRRKPKNAGAPDIKLKLMPANPSSIKLDNGMHLASMTLNKADIKLIRKAILHEKFSTVYFIPVADTGEDNIDGFKWIISGAATAFDGSFKAIAGAKFNPSPPREFSK